jgi:hypothetical protein
MLRWCSSTIFESEHQSELNTSFVMTRVRPKSDIGCIDPRSLIGFHDVKLALHRVQLVTKDTILSISDGEDRDCQSRYYPGGPCQTRSRRVGAIFLLFVGAAVMKIALDPSKPWPFAIGLWIVAAASIFQGTVLLLIGQWFL